MVIADLGTMERNRCTINLLGGEDGSMRRSGKAKMKDQVVPAGPRRRESRHPAARFRTRQRSQRLLIRATLSRRTAGALAAAPGAVVDGILPRKVKPLEPATA